MKRLLGMLCAALLLFVGGCAPKNETAGCWVADETADFYFELDKDGSCNMFNKDDELVSWGTYTVTDTGLSFELDTGAFTWVRQKDQTMLFEANGTVLYYHRTE